MNAVQILLRNRIVVYRIRRPTASRGVWSTLRFFAWTSMRMRSPRCLSGRSLSKSSFYKRKCSSTSDDEQKMQWIHVHRLNISLFRTVAC